MPPKPPYMLLGVPYLPTLGIAWYTPPWV